MSVIPPVFRRVRYFYSVQTLAKNHSGLWEQVPEESDVELQDQVNAFLKRSRSQLDVAPTMTASPLELSPDKRVLILTTAVVYVPAEESCDERVEDEEPEEAGIEGDGEFVT